MKVLFVVGLLILISALGFIRLRRRLNNLGDKREFVEDFLAKLNRYVSSQGEDHEVYGWLVHRSPKMQSLLGSLGVCICRPPFANYVVHDYQIVINTLPELRRAYKRTFSSRLAQEDAALILETLLRYQGFVDDQLEDIRPDLRNPVIWFREGVRFVLLVPVSLLNWVGLLGETAVTRISGSIFFKMFSGLVTLLSFIGLVIGLVVDWSDFLTILRQALDLWR